MQHAVFFSDNFVLIKGRGLCRFFSDIVGYVEGAPKRIAVKRRKALANFTLYYSFFNVSNLCGISMRTRVRPVANELLRAKEECYRKYQSRRESNINMR